MKRVFFLGARAVEGAAEVHGIVGENADGVASETGEAAYEGRCAVAADFEEGAAVGNDLDDVPDVVGGPLVLGHDFEEDLILAVGGVVGGDVRRHLPDVLGEVTEDGLDLAYGVGVVLGDVIHDTGDDCVDLDPAQLELVDAVTQGPLDEGRTSGEDAGGLGHDAEVGDGDSGSGDTRAGAHGCGHYRDLSH